MKFQTRAFYGVAVIGVVTALLMPQPSSAANVKLTLKDEPRPSNIRLQETEMGVVFADSLGMTLYTDRDDPKENVPACVDKETKVMGADGEETIVARNPLPVKHTCLTKHIPVEVGDAKPVGPWTVLERPNGVKQWAYRGHAVYRSVKDLAPGQTWLSFEPGLRQFRKRWSILFAPVDLPPDIMLQTIGAARVFATFSGRTLYTLAQDRPGKSSCEGACLDKWQPFLGGSMSQSRGEWTLVTRSDGARQWALHGKPLYTFTGDRRGAEVKGNNLPGSQVAIAYAAPPPPSFMTIQTTPIGDVYANEKGMTLYAFLCPAPGNTEIECDDAGEKTHWWFVTCGNSPEKCAEQWHPVLAAPDAKPMGNTWTIVTLPLPWSPVRAPEGSTEPGVRVWAQNGRPLFTYSYEDRPGMIDGMDVGTFLGPRFYGILAAGGNLNSKDSITQASR